MLHIPLTKALPYLKVTLIPWVIMIYRNFLFTRKSYKTSKFN